MSTIDSLYYVTVDYSDTMESHSMPVVLLVVTIQCCVVWFQAFWIRVEDVDSEVILHHEYFLLKSYAFFHLPAVDSVSCFHTLPCSCGVTQTMSHIVESCPQTRLHGGLSKLHSADDDAIAWLTSYGY